MQILAGLSPFQEPETQGPLLPLLRGMLPLRATHIWKCLLGQICYAITSRLLLQGLEVSSDGRALARPPRQDLEQWVEEQVAWAASSETTSAQYMEAFAFRRGKALQGAGKPCCC